MIRIPRIAAITLVMCGCWSSRPAPAPAPVRRTAGPTLPALPASAQQWLSFDETSQFWPLKAGDAQDAALAELGADEALAELRRQGAASIVYDRVAAHYATRRKFDDALQVLDAADRTAVSSQASERCERALNLVRLETHTAAKTGLPGFIRFSGHGEGEDCRRRASALVCEESLRSAARTQRIPDRNGVVQRCHTYLGYRSDMSPLFLMAAAMTWPLVESGPDIWLYVAELASEGVALDGGLEMEQRALDWYIDLLGCDGIDRLRVKRVLQRANRAIEDRCSLL